MATGWIRKNQKTGSWWGRVDLPRHSDGRRNQVRVAGLTKAECEKKLRKLLEAAELGRPLPTKARVYTVNDAIETWLQSRRDVATNTFESYQNESRRHLRPKFGRIPVAELRPSLIQRVVSEWQTEPLLNRRPGRRSSTSVRYYLTLLWMVLELARLDGFRPDNPVDSVRRPKRVKPLKPAADAPGAARILSGVKGTALFAPLFLQFSQGIRPGELLAFQRGDVSTTVGEIEIQRALSARGKRLEYKPPKTEEGRRKLYLAKSVGELLESTMREQEQRLAKIGFVVDSTTPLFDNGAGAVWHPDAFRREYKKALARAQVRPIPWRGARHTFATIAQGQKTDPHVLKGILGHSSVVTTQTFYVDDACDANAFRTASSNVIDLIVEHMRAATLVVEMNDVGSALTEKRRETSESRR
jgi:integrase